MTSHPTTNRTPHKKTPKQLALIDPDCCTGCGACVEVCPVEAITKVGGEGGLPGLRWWYEVDGDRCIGCGFCVEMPKKRAEVYAVTVCPWQAIEMVAAERRIETGQEIGRGEH
jgi:electron transport complex protein RnfB